MHIHKHLLCTLLLYVPHALKNYFSHYLVDFNLEYVHKTTKEKHSIRRFLKDMDFFFSKKRSISKNNINFINKQCSPSKVFKKVAKNVKW